MKSNQILRDPKNFDKLILEQSTRPEDYYRYYRDSGLGDQEYQKSLLIAKTISDLNKRFESGLSTNKRFSIYDDIAKNKLDLYDTLRSKGRLQDIDEKSLRRDFDELFDDAKMGAEDIDYDSDYDIDDAEFALSEIDRRIFDKIYNNANKKGIQGMVSGIDHLFNEYPVSQGLWDPKRLKKVGYE